ncbi:MAG: MerR family transcriptional regulator [Defluviitaleaceae bacterium]|nr:MerR family transcriptional regulator [Defluviitaleaceae bacterium]
MNNLTKIKDMSARYGISARTLRYYEDMGLITSIRTDEYAYRLYDEAAVKKLEQILILRKLNISIKDIHIIFNSSGSDIVLDVLGKKIDDIDGEISLLHELKHIISSFVNHFRKIDFNKESDIKLLFEKAKEIEQQIITMEYEGNPSSFKRLIEINDNLRLWHHEPTLVRLPKFKAVSTGYHTAADEDRLWSLWAWIDKNEHVIPFKKHLTKYGLDFILTKDGKFSMICAVNDDINKTDLAPYELIEFKGGLYATSISHEGYDESLLNGASKIMRWIENSNFTYDNERQIMGENINDDEEIQKGLKCYQFLLYVPIKLRV